MADEDGEERDHDFIEDIPNFLTCAICLSVLKDPYQTPCGHRFCSKCIRPVMASDNSVCPTDRKEISAGNTFPDNAVKLQINGLKVRCPMAAQGCEWTGELCNEAAHLSRCSHARVECRLCGESVPRDALQRHSAAECPSRPVQCEYCHCRVPYSQMKQHYFQECPQYPELCPNRCCDDQFPRQELLKHLQECLCVVVRCPFDGCGAEVKRRDLPAHSQQAAPHHLSLLAGRVHGQREEITALKRTVEEQARLISRLEEERCPWIGQLTWKIDSIRGKIQQAREKGPEMSAINSPPFYSQPAGYKMRLCVYPAGDINSEFLSLYFVLMRGPFDEILKWPFCERVTLTLINVHGGLNLVKEIAPNPRARLHYFQRPHSEQNVGYGYPKFMPITKLDSSGSEFIVDDALFIHVYVHKRH